MADQSQSGRHRLQRPARQCAAAAAHGATGGGSPMSRPLQPQLHHPQPVPARPVRSVARLVRLGQWRSAGVALVCAGLFMSAASLYSLQQYALHALAMAAHSLAFAGEPAIRFRDLEALREQLASVTVLDARGQRLLRVERPGQGAFDGLARRVADLFMPEPVRAPVEGGWARCNCVRMAASCSATWACCCWPCWAVWW